MGKVLHFKGVIAFDVRKQYFFHFWPLGLDALSRPYRFVLHHVVLVAD